MVTGSTDDTDEMERFRQKRRRPRAPRDPDEYTVSDEIARTFDLIPEIGEGRRWYDLPYRILDWLSRGWRRRILPRRAILALTYGINYLYPYNQHDRNWVQSRNNWLHNIFVPDEEHVTVAGLWAIELFPPSQLPAFENAIAKNGWTRPGWWVASEQDNTATLQRARSGRGAIWWKIVDVVRKGSSDVWIPGAIRADLPKEFRAVELRAIQVGAGITAVVANFKLTESTQSSLDREWHREHDPILVHGSLTRRPRSLDRLQSALEQTQKERRGLHDAARNWMSGHVPGLFAENDSSQLVLDLLLFEKYDPTSESSEKLEQREASKWTNALRAIGISNHESYQIVSPSLEKLVLSPLDTLVHSELGDRPTWTLLGNRKEIVNAWGDNAFMGFSDSTDRGIAYRVESAYYLLLMLAVSKFLDISEQRYAEIRDRATMRHGRFKPNALRELRRNFLTLSLDLATVQRETADFWADARQWAWEGAKFVYQPSPWIRSRDRKRANEAPRSFNKRVRKAQERRFTALVAADREYRDILSTVASIGASADSFKVGRWALWVALASLAVAVATIVLADVGCHSVVQQVFGWAPVESCDSKVSSGE